MNEFESVAEILSTEASIHVLRRTLHGGDYLDSMASLREKLIEKHNSNFPKRKYNSQNDFC